MIDGAGSVTGQLGIGVGQFKMANGIAVDDTGYIYVVDSLDNCVQVFNPAGGFVRRFGTFGMAAGQLSTPTGIAFERLARHLAVVDTRNGRIQFFDTNGTFVRSIGAFGSGPLKFTAPQGVAFEYSNDPTPVLKRIYVVDTFQGQVQVVEPAAVPVFLAYIGGYGTTNGKLMVPSDLRFDQANSRLLVVNGYGNLTVYGIDGGGVTTDTVPPSLDIDPMVSPFYTPALELHGSVEAGASVTVTAGGGTTVGTLSFPTPTTWRVSLAGFAPGDTVLTVTARDAAGNASTKTATVTYLQQAPYLTVDSVPAAVTNAFAQHISGAVEPGCTVTVTNAATGITANATVFGDTWSHTVVLAPGVNSVTVKAVRPLSAAALAAFSVILDTAAPVLTVSALADGSYTSEQVQNIRIEANDAYPGEVSVNGRPITMTNGAGSTAVTLSPGANVITVSAADLAGNRTVNTRTIVFDCDLPVVTFTSPADGAFVAVDHVTVSGTVDQAATVTVAGHPARFDGSVWSADVPLNEGLNTIEVVAVDFAGNTTAVKRTLTYDAGSPAIVITSPAQDMAVNRQVVGLVGSANDTSPVTVTADVDGVPVEVTSAEGSFSLSVHLVEEGAHAVTVRATDAAGNAGAVTRTLIYDVTPPVLTLNEVNTVYPAELSGTVERGATVAVEDHSGSVGEVTITEGAWHAVLTLGSYDPDSLAVKATDAAGNSMVRSLVVRVPDGDVDGDGRITVVDALVALRIFTGQLSPSASHLAGGDIGPLYQGKSRPNGVIDLVDAILILRKAIGLQSW
ncbi:Ig-like domain-containing protein [Geobacter sulfurreducens]|uniref:Ig-like domain-containing protein n=1 Tax=Geobacter sulfurreducens TaxID=35554 RepID=UPI000DBB695E|nr:Ig-like domain-containing protein [Geobacter sulfurreducens]BBA71315.1 Bacillopeptidase F [Geobacter sulfurreducens]